MHLTEELVLRAEELLLRRDLEGAARYCRDALAQLDAQSWSSEHGVRLLSVAMQSSWPLGRCAGGWAPRVPVQQEAHRPRGRLVHPQAG